MIKPCVFAVVLLTVSGATLAGVPGADAEPLSAEPTSASANVHQADSHDQEAPYKEAVVLNHIEERQKQPLPPGMRVPTDIWLEPDAPISSFAPLDCDIQYECTGARFFLEPVEPEEREGIEARVQRVAALSFSECYSVANDFENEQTQVRCRFVRKLPYAPDVFRGDASVTMSSWQTTLSPETIREVWLESAVRTDSTGLPLEKAPNVRPIVLTTDKRSYLVIERVAPSAEFARQLAVDGQRLFSFQKTSDLRASIHGVMRVFVDELEKSFRGNPLLATRAANQPQLDGELILTRARQKSTVIGRESWLPSFFNSAYEISTYTVKWFSTDKVSMGSSTEHGFFGKGAAGTFGPNVFVQIEHIFLISADGVNYREKIASEAQMQGYLALYQRAVDQAFRKAQRDTCYRRLAGKGMMANGTCEIKGDVR